LEARALQDPDALLAEFPGVTPPSDADIDCLATRQLFTKSEAIRERTLGVGGCCKHGWPQAILSDPIWSSGKMSGMVWLTCPLLATAIEQYEASGAVDCYNERAHEDEEWRGQVLRTNREHNLLRRRLTEGRELEMQRVREVLGSKTVDLLLGRGLDLPLNSTKIRCLHAHTADELTRGGNLVGQQVLQDLMARGVAVNGTDSCGEHCGMKAALSKISWHFETHKSALRHMQRKQAQREEG